MAATETLVLKDEQGNYYVLPREIIENSKVTDAAKKRELQQTVEGGDTSGFAAFTAQPLRFGAANLSLAGRCSCNWSFDQLGRVR